MQYTITYTNLKYVILSHVVVYCLELCLGSLYKLLSLRYVCIYAVYIIHCPLMCICNKHRSLELDTNVNTMPFLAYTRLAIVQFEGEVFCRSLNYTPMAMQYSIAL